MLCDFYILKPHLQPYMAYGAKKSALRLMRFNLLLPKWIRLIDMATHTSPIFHINTSVLYDICASESILICQYIGFIDMTAHASPVFHINTSVARYIPYQIDLHILGHGFRAYRDGVLTGDVVILGHP